MMSALIIPGLLIALTGQLVGYLARNRIRARVSVLRGEGVLPSNGHRLAGQHPLSDAMLVLTDYRHIGDDQVKVWSRIKDFGWWVGMAGLLLLVAAFLVPMIQSRF